LIQSYNLQMEINSFILNHARTIKVIVFGVSVYL
jgi:hypothetical protein